MDMIRTGDGPVRIQESCVHGLTLVPGVLLHHVSKHECHAIRKTGLRQILYGLRLANRAIST